MEGSSISQQWVDVLGMVGSLSNTCTAILAARITDKLRGHMKISIFILLSLASILFTGLTLVSVQVISTYLSYLAHLTSSVIEVAVSWLLHEVLGEEGPVSPLSILWSTFHLGFPYIIS